MLQLCEENTPVKKEKKNVRIETNFESFHLTEPKIYEDIIILKNY